MAIPAGVRWRRWRSHGGAGGDAGSATAEMAVALPALIVVLVAALAAVSAVTAQLRCADAASRAARLAARGEPTGAALGSAPGGARLALSRSGGEVSATVTIRWSLGPHLPGVELSAAAVAEAEPGEPQS
jgi:Flp pilus assembly protein TadG